MSTVVVASVTLSTTCVAFVMLSTTAVASVMLSITAVASVMLSDTNRQQTPHCSCPVQRYIFQPQYGSLPAEEKRALLEEGFCPASAQLQDCNDLKMNFAIDWNLLQPALKMAFLDMQEKHSHILDGLGSL